MEKRILGIDPGLAVLGFGAISCQENHDGKTPSVADGATPAVGDGETPSVADRSKHTTVKMIDFGVISTPADAEVEQRLCTLYDDLHTLMEELQPDLVAIEKLFFYRMSSTILVAQARGVIMLVIGQRRVPYVEFTPAQIKLALANHGNADKSEVQDAVARELDLDYIPRPDDAADALAVALTAFFQM